MATNIFKSALMIALTIMPNQDGGWNQKDSTAVSALHLLNLEDDESH